MRTGPTVTRWLKFNAVGGLGIVLQLGVLEALTWGLQLNYLAATGVAVEAAIIHNFLWHERFTWSDRSSGPGTASRFLRFNLSTGAFSILGNLGFMRLFAGEAHLPYLLANGLSIATCSLVNFVVSDRFVFSGPPAIRRDLSS